MGRFKNGQRIRKEVSGEEVLPHGSLRGDKLAPSMSNRKERNPLLGEEGVYESDDGGEREEQEQYEFVRRSGKEVVSYDANEVEEDEEEEVEDDVNEEDREEEEGEGQEQGDDDGGEEQPQFIKKKPPRRPDTRKLNNIDANGPFPGGPNNAKLLMSFYDHIALRITIGDERQHLLKVINHSTKLCRWDINAECEAVRTQFQETGLASLTYLIPSTNKLNITAFVERWQPETNSFHMAFGEMTVTLEDVHRITGLKIDGDLLINNEKKAKAKKDIKKDAIKLLTELLHIETSVAAEEINRSQTIGNVRLEWLREKFSGKASDDDPTSVRTTLRAYCLYLLGCTIFCDKSGSGVSVQWLNFLINVEKIKNVAWGTAALVYLYRQLGIGSRGDNQQITGYLVLLEVWIYEHFPNLFRGGQVDSYMVGMPLMMKYKECPVYGDQMVLLKNLRRLLDEISPESVRFDPYQNDRADGIPTVSLYRGILVCSDIHEVYLPDRVVRQFGYVQDRPEDPIVPKKSRRGTTGRVYEVKYYKQNNFHYSQWNDQTRAYYLDLDQYQEVEYPWDCEQRYLKWFQKNSHVHITPDNVEEIQPVQERPRLINNVELVPKLKKAYSLSAELMKTDDNKKFKTVKKKVEKLLQLLGGCFGTSAHPAGDGDDSDDEELRTKIKHDRPAAKKRRRT